MSKRATRIAPSPSPSAADGGGGRSGISLIELLIVIAIIGLLVQLLLPAIQASREAARRTSCANNLRQIGIGIQSHEAALKHFPAGGWGYLYVGDPDRGTGKDQPGGWIYNTLPYVEQAPLHDLGKGFTGEEKLQATSDMLTTAIDLFNCPSRRPPRPMPFDHEQRPYGNYRPPDFVGKSDYAGNAGDFFGEDTEDNEGPPSYDRADEEGDDTRKFWIDASIMTGIFYQRSTTRTEEVTDGLSKTYLAGEKYADPLRYTDRNTTAGDDQCMYVGADSDVIRWAGHYDGRDLLPIQDKNNFEDDETFGSPHPSGVPMLFCDGSVRMIPYDVDGTAHRQMANRRDGGTSTKQQAQ